MRLIFEQSVKKPISTHPFSFLTCLPKIEGHSNDSEAAQSSREKLIEYIHRKLLIIGITDCLYELGEAEETSSESCRLTFHFKTEFQSLQFQALITRNDQRPFMRDITSENARASVYQTEKLSRFLEMHGIKHIIARKDEKTITVQTAQRHDDLIIAMQVLNKAFDEPSHASSSPSQAMLLSRSNG